VINFNIQLSFKFQPCNEISSKLSNLIIYMIPSTCYSSMGPFISMSILYHYYRPWYQIHPYVLISSIGKISFYSMNSFVGWSSTMGCNQSHWCHQLHSIVGFRPTFIFLLSMLIWINDERLMTRVIFTCKDYVDVAFQHNDFFFNQWWSWKLLFHPILHFTSL